MSKTATKAPAPLEVALALSLSLAHLLIRKGIVSRADLDELNKSMKYLIRNRKVADDTP